MRPCRSRRTPSRCRDGRSPWYQAPPDGSGLAGHPAEDHGVLLGGRRQQRAVGPPVAQPADSRRDELEAIEERVDLLARAEEHRSGPAPGEDALDEARELG